MLFNYLKIALRNILRHKSFSVINIAGLTIGLTAFLAISLYIVDEFTYDRFHEKKDRIYRAVIVAEFDGQVNKWGGAPNRLATTSMKEIPEVEKATRVFHHNFGELGFVSTDQEKFSETELFYADPEIFDIFSIDLIKGSKANALNRPGTVVISEQAAKKYFGQSDPMGKSLTVDNSLALEVTGVYRDFPSNSFLQCKLIASFSSNWFGLEKNQSWGNASFDTYFLLHPSAQPVAVEGKIKAMLDRNLTKDSRWFEITLQPLLDIRLYSGDLNATFDRRVYGDINQIKIVGALALAILLIAAINYMNLTTAQSQRRNKEVGISKTLGATYQQLYRKFYFEAAFFVLISLLLSVAVFTLVLPIFNALTGKEIGLGFITTQFFWLGFAGVWLCLTFLAGFYPALYLSSFSPKAALQKTSAAGGQATIRKSLVVFQFAVSIMLIICSIVFYKQLNFMRTKKLGFKPEQVVAIMVSGAKDEAQITTVKNAFENISNVVKVSRSQSYPGMGTSMRNLARPGEKEEGTSLLTTRSSSETLEVLGISLLAGKTLPVTKDPRDTTVQVVLNKSVVDYLQLSPEEAVGQRVNIQGFDGLAEVVGVCEDFHITSMHQKIGAFCFHNASSEPLSFLLVKISAGDVAATLQQLQQAFQKNIPTAFEYSFLDQHMASLYQSEQTLSDTILLFAGLAIFVACLGLYALAAFTAEQRTKEIGIRKVMGASVPHLITMLSKEFMLLVLAAFVIGIPSGYYMMNHWLESFAYRTEITWAIFAAAGAISLLIAWFTVSFESFKAANNNPVKSLRAE
jgi:putative ABC transport system permease protein